MKNNMMKKLLTMTLACAMTLSLAACGSKAEPSADQSTAAPIETDTKAYKVAIIKQLTTLLWTRSPTPSLRSWIKSPPIRM